MKILKPYIDLIFILDERTYDKKDGFGLSIVFDRYTAVARSAFDGSYIPCRFRGER
jgi:hypothetical protein